MGQAKQRGSREDRITQASKLAEYKREMSRLIYEQRQLEAKAAWEALPEEEKHRRREDYRASNKRSSYGMLGLGIALAHAYYPGGGLGWTPGPARSSPGYSYRR